MASITTWNASIAMTEVFQEPDCSFNIYQNIRCGRWIGLAQAARAEFPSTLSHYWSLQWRHNERDGNSNHRRLFHLMTSSCTVSICWKRYIYVYTSSLTYICPTVRIHMICSCLCVYEFTFIYEIFIKRIGIYMDDNINIQIAAGYNIQPLCSNLVWQAIIKIKDQWIISGPMTCNSWSWDGTISIACDLCGFDD